MTDILTAVDAAEFDRLFIQQLGWHSPVHQPITVTDPYGNAYTVTQVASFRGMGIWTCPTIPERDAQRQIDSAVAAQTIERLIIYSDQHHQEWRWPRSTSRKRSGPPTLVPHRHTVGQPNPALLERLGLITIPMGGDITVPELLDRMREAFDREAETASKQAARLMGGLYEKLDIAGMGEQESSVFLARMLFLMFGDDTAMWKRNLFHDFLAEHTAPDGSDLREKLLEIFLAADSHEKQRPDDLSPGLHQLPYINGGIFAQDIRIPDLDAEFRKALLETCRFDWGQISPAVFGSMFQTVKTKEARRHLGEHYTTEENILKTIEPLFLDELRERLDAAWNDRKKLTKLHKELGELRFLDPACGCGNFLIVAYRELRALELALMIRQRDLAAAAGDQKALQLAVDATHALKVSIDQFYGIELEPWPARIAETAMFLIDHQANQRMDHELGSAPTRLPLEVSPHIINADALSTDWASVLTPGESTFVFGNPPFLGISSRSELQTAQLQTVWGHRYHGTLDYVTGWHACALKYFAKCDGRWAFVTTNSITQGEAVAPLFQPIIDAGWKIKFAHRTFKWTSEASGQAAVHCVIVGFDRAPTSRRLFDYTTIEGPPIEIAAVTNINPYLTDAPDVAVMPATRPLNERMGEVYLGNKPTDGGALILAAEELPSKGEDPIAWKFIKPYIGARELLHGEQRYCLWLVDSTEEERDESPFIRNRVEARRNFLLLSKAASTRAYANSAHLFRQIAQPNEPYLCIPTVVSENRPYFLASRFTPDVIASNSNFVSHDPDGIVFAVISSTMFIVWQRTVGGRLESRLRFNKLITWNTFPLPFLSGENRDAIVEAGEGVLQARASLDGMSLVDMYPSGELHTKLQSAHDALDSVVDAAFGMESGHGATYLERQRILFGSYVELTSGLFSD